MEEKNRYYYRSLPIADVTRIDNKLHCTLIRPFNMLLISLPNHDMIESSSTERFGLETVGDLKKLAG